MTCYLYRYAGYAIGFKVWNNGYTFLLNDNDTSQADFLKALQDTGAHKETAESVVKDVLSGIRALALKNGWRSTAELTNGH